MSRRVQVTWRHAGGKRPDDVVYVGRPSRWGNPYPVEVHGRPDAVAMFEAYARDRARTDRDWLAPLNGKRLACWCPTGEPCHADVLLRLLEEAR